MGERGRGPVPIDAVCAGLYTPRMSRKIAALALLCALGAAGCSLPRITEPSNAAQVDNAQQPALIAPTLDAPAIQPTRSNDDIATEVPPPPENCPPPPVDVPIPPIDDVLNYGDFFIEYLNLGGTLERLAEHAEELNLLGDIGVPEGFMRPDLNGDGIPEMVVSLVDWMGSFSEGKVYVAMCEGGEYRLSYASPDRNDFGTAQIDSVFDMTGDSLDDMIIRRRGCGAHTCFEWIEVVVWHEGQLQNQMEDVYFDLPSTGIEFVGPELDGSYQIHMTGNGVASIGAGPYHRRSVTWEWDQDAHLFRPRELELLPSTWRIHFIHDGDQAFTNGNYPQALDAYERVIHDTTLMDWPSAEFAPEFAEQRPQELAAYARFRRILTHLKMDDFALAEVHYQDLIDNHSPGEPGAGFARMGEIFWEEFKISRDFNSACEEAQDFAAANPSEVIEPLDYGYSNLTYTPSGLCPTTP